MNMRKILHAKNVFIVLICFSFMCDAMQKPPSPVKISIATKALFDAVDLSVSEDVCIKLAEEALDRGADINGQNEHGQTPLHVAAGMRNVAMVTWLLEHKASLFIRDGTGATPFHTPAQLEYEDIIRLLVRYDHNGNARKIGDCYKVTPLQIAERKRYKTIADLLCGRDSESIAADFILMGNGDGAIESLVTVLPHVHALMQARIENPRRSKGSFSCVIS
jgi:hypothetical protein